MERGLYAAASGMLAQQAIQESLAQNIANANTVGYKQDNPTFRAVQGMALRRLANGMGRGPEIGELGMGVANDQVYTDWQTGPLSQTGNPLDASLGDNQFFAVRTPVGERYTRAGNFRLDGAGNLLTASGLPVLGSDNRPINAQGKNHLALDAAGNLTADKQPLVKLKIVETPTANLTKQGDTLFAALSPAIVRPAARPVLRPGTLEQSNMNPVEGLVRMITVSRGFEMAQRALTTQDEMLRHAANDVGRL
jgi:flagellar basal-body rod protein FlgF